MIDRERFDMLRLVRCDFEDGTFAGYCDAVQYHLNPDQSFAPDLGSLALQLQEAHAEISSLHSVIAEGHTLFKNVPAALAELLSEVRSLSSEVAHLCEQPLTPRRSEDYREMLAHSPPDAGINWSDRRRNLHR